MDAPYVVKTENRRDLIDKMRFDRVTDARQYARDQKKKHKKDPDITITLDRPGRPLEFVLLGR